MQTNTHTRDLLNVGEGERERERERERETICREVVENEVVYI